MKRIGITGSIGSGKSFVGELLRERGFLVLDADAEVHELYRTCEPLRKKLSETFGSGCLMPNACDGVNRKFFAELIFKDDAAREKLQNIVYPYLTQSIKIFFESASMDGCARESNFKFVEAALFSRTPAIVDMLDEIWIVDAPEDVRLRRLIARGLDPDDAMRRIENQRGVCSADLFSNKIVRTLANDEGRPCIERQLLALL